MTRAALATIAEVAACCVIATRAPAAPIPSPDFTQLPPITTRTIARSSGAVLSTSRSWIEPLSRNGESLVTVVSSIALSADSTAEERTIARAEGAVRCLEQHYTVRDAGGQVVAMHMRQFRPEAVRYYTETVPDDTYPPTAMLLYLIAGLPLDERGHGSFHVLGENGVWRMLVRAAGTEEVSVPAGRYRCRHLRLRPDPDTLNVPGLLRPFLRYFIPEFDVYVMAEPPHLAVRINGPFGPPRERDIMVELTEVGAPAR
jgi:hypothetical protein